MMPWSLELFWETINPTFIENWPQAIRERALPALDLQVPQEELLAAMSHTRFRNWFPNLRPFMSLDALTERINDGLNHFEGGAFLRLGSRSPKDAVQAQQFGLHIENGGQGVGLLTGNSRRVAFDIRSAMDYSYLPRLFLRPWRTIPAWSEFRCFIQSGEVVGLSQYDFRFLGRSELLLTHAKIIEAALRHELEVIIPHLHLSDVVVDLILVPADDPDGIITAGHLERGAVVARLLELNPFFMQTNPALFSWLEPMDGSFRLVR